MPPESEQILEVFDEESRGRGLGPSTLDSDLRPPRDPQDDPRLFHLSEVALRSVRSRMRIVAK